MSDKDEFACKPIRVAGRFGIQQFGLRGDLWRVVEIVTHTGLYIDHGDAYASRETATKAAERMARS